MFEAWEFMLVTFMHEATIQDVRLRRSLFSLADSQMFIYKSIDSWKEGETHEEFCKVKELNFTNTC